MGFYSGILLPMPDNVLTTMFSSELLFMSDFVKTIPLNDGNLRIIKNIYKNCQTETQKIIALNEYLNCLKYELMTDQEYDQIETFGIEEGEE
jgi:hypothetical protein